MPSSLFALPRQFSNHCEELAGKPAARGFPFFARCMDAEDPESLYCVVCHKEGNETHWSSSQHERNCRNRLWRQNPEIYCELQVRTLTGKPTETATNYKKVDEDNALQWFLPSLGGQAVLLPMAIADLQVPPPPQEVLPPPHRCTLQWSSRDGQVTLYCHDCDHEITWFTTQVEGCPMTSHAVRICRTQFQ